MKKIVRNVFALLLALTFILSLAACGGNSASSGAAPAASGSEELRLPRPLKRKTLLPLLCILGGTSPNLSTCRR